MTIKTLSLFLFVLLPAFAAAEEAKLLSFSGNVEVRTSREGQWTSALENMEIPEGGAIRTSSEGSAVVLLPNKTKVWLKESSNLELEQRKTLASRLSLLMGRIKVRVPHLMRKEKFEVKTPSAVCAVRGTEFTMETTEAGAMNINVLFGEVKLNFTVPLEKGKTEFYIPQGRNLSFEEKGKPAKMALMTSAQERGSLENWNPGLKPEDRQNDLKAKENDRAQVREYARVTNNSENTVKTFLNTVKESDLEAGRTLRDVHGNTVRVDQRLMRPDGQTIQFFNLVKRPTYNYSHDVSASGGFKYNGGTLSDRLDLMQLNMHFNKELPQRIEEWPSFFGQNSVNADWATFIAANRTHVGEIFVIAEGYRYDAARDEIINNTSVVGIAANNTAGGGADRDVLMTGILESDVNSTAVEKLSYLSRLNVADANIGVAAPNGTLKYEKDGTLYRYDVTTPNSFLWARQIDNAPGSADMVAIGLGQPVANFRDHYEVTGDPALWQYSADAYMIGGKHANGYFWYARENYVIGNSGGIKQVEDFTKSSLDPFTILKESAGETILSIKKAVNAPSNWTSNAAAYNGINNTATGDKFTSSLYPSGVNIDLVFIPDLALAAVQRILPAITELNK